MNSHFSTFRRLLGELFQPSGNRRLFQSWWPWRTTAAQRLALLRLIAVATEEKLPLVPLLESWTADERGVQERRLRRLIGLLQQGMSLPDAVEQVRGVLRDEDVLAIRFGAQSGILAAAVRERIEQAEPAPRSGMRGMKDTLWYFFVVLIFAALVVTFIEINISPEMFEIMEEFSMTPPVVMRWSQGIDNFFVQFWWLVALVVIALLWLVLSNRFGRYVRHAIFGRLVRPVRELRSAEVLQKLSLATRAGRPIPGALSTLARYHFDPTIRNKLLFVRNEVEQGADVWQSMAATRLLTPQEERVLQTSERIGNRVWALQQLASVKKRRTNRRLQRLADLLLPILVLLMGAFVLFQGLTVFVLLTQMIWELT